MHITAVLASLAAAYSGHWGVPSPCLQRFGWAGQLRRAAQAAQLRVPLELPDPCLDQPVPQVGAACGQWSQAVAQQHITVLQGLLWHPLKSAELCLMYAAGVLAAGRLIAIAVAGILGPDTASSGDRGGPLCCTASLHGRHGAAACCTSTPGQDRQLLHRACESYRLC